MTYLSFADYDHENERHVELTLMEGCRLVIERRIETNTDYLASGASAPDDWSDEHTLEFRDAAQR
jgi:hypothetical protein